MTSEFLHLGPSILKTKISDNLLYKLLHHVETLFDGPTQDYSSNLAGKNTHQCLLEYHVAQSTGLEEVILLLGHEYLNKYNLNCDLKLLDCWINICKQSDYNPIHQHGGLLSGIIYIQCPPTINDTDGHTQFIFGQEMQFGNNLLTIKPESATLLLFPSWLMHTAYPTKSMFKRTTISFNLGN